MMIGLDAHTEHHTSRPPAPPVLTREELLPLLSVSIDYQRFQAFCLDLVRHLPGLNSAAVHGSLYHYGKPGDAQRGIDIVCRTHDGRTIGIQCKREQAFSPARVHKMVAAATYPADEYIAFLACEATVSVRDAIAKYTNWRLLDARDISGLVREELPPIEAARLIRHHFGNNWCGAFLGLSGAPRAITYEQSTLRRVGTLTRRKLVGLCFLGSIAAFAIVRFFLLALGHVSWAALSFAAVPLSFAFALGLVLPFIGIKVATKRTAFFCLGMILEIAENGDLYRAELRASCPCCAGDVEVASAPAHVGLNLVGTCRNRPNLHVFTFDDTTMSGELLPLELRERLARPTRHPED